MMLNSLGGKNGDQWTKDQKEITGIGTGILCLHEHYTLSLMGRLT